MGGCEDLWAITAVVGSWTVFGLQFGMAFVQPLRR